MHDYNSLCDDFGISTYVNTKMELPNKRETVLHFFGALQKAFPELTDFDTRGSGDFYLEQDRESGLYRWVSLERHRICSGYVNPPSIDDVDRQNEIVLEMAPYHLDFAAIDCELIDVAFTFNFLYSGNHDEVVAEALGLHSSLESLLQMPGSKVLDYKPTMTLALEDGCRLQCLLNVETRTNTYQVRTGQFPEAPISVFFTVRQYWGRQGGMSLIESYRNQRQTAQDLVERHVVPAVIRPLSETIANKQ
jgi:hypothetical protein